MRAVSATISASNGAGGRDDGRRDPRRDPADLLHKHGEGVPGPLPIAALAGKLLPRDGWSLDGVRAVHAGGGARGVVARHQLA
jgi:hypothetical protein